MTTNLPTANVIHRTFGIRFNGEIGTGFALDHDGRQYLVTAKHLVDGLADEGTLDLLSNWTWSPSQVKLVGHSAHADISVIAFEQNLVPDNLPLESIDDDHKLTYGQMVFFLGFPYGEFGPEFDNGSHLPFVKRATVSLLTKEFFVLDGHNNKGFSGGPVVFNPIQGDSGLRVAAVISSYEVRKDQVYGPSGKSPLYSWDNTGLIKAYSVIHAIDLMNANPIGFLLP